MQSQQNTSSRGAIDGLMRLGLAACEKGQLNNAAMYFRQVIVINDRLPVAKFYLAQVLVQSGELAEAARYFKQVLDLKPDHVDAVNNLGVVLMKLGRSGEAVAYLRQACELMPNNVNMKKNLAASLKSQDMLEQAAEIYQQVLVVQPDDITALQQLGIMSEHRQSYENAERYFRQAIAAEPGNHQLQMNLAQNLLMQNKPEDAGSVFDRVVDIAGSVNAHVKSAALSPVIYTDRDEIEHWRKRIFEKVDQLSGRSLHTDNPNEIYIPNRFFFAYHGCNNRELMQCIARMSMRICPSLNYQSPHCESRGSQAANEKLSLAFISSHFTGHTIAKFMQGIIKHISRDRFAVTVVSCSEHSNPTSQAIARVADHYLVLPQSLIESQKVLGEKQFDIIFYPDIGMNPMTYFLPFARLAPVQCVTWGHPDTTGIPNVDYFISSDDLEVDGKEAHYSEKLITMQHLPTYYYRPKLLTEYANKTRGDFGLSEDRHLYICPQALFKLHPDFDRIIAGILANDPKGHLILIQTAAKNLLTSLMKRWRASMPTLVDRIVVMDSLPRSGFLALLKCCDVMLDPLHFGGGNTTYEALSLGVPIVTLPTAFMRTRVTYACYRKMGLDECIAADEAAYVNQAMRIAGDKVYRKTIEQKILARNDILYENIDAVRELEEVLVKAAG